MAHESDEIIEIEKERFSARAPKRRLVTTTDEYIEAAAGAAFDGDSDSQSGEDGNFATNAGAKAVWSGDETDTLKNFRNRKINKRKRVAAVKKKMNKKAKEYVALKRQAKKDGVKPRRELMYGDSSDNGLEDEEIPDYIRTRRRDFDDAYHRLKEAGLKLPPVYDDVDFSDDETAGDLDERPVFPASVEFSRDYKDVELPNSAGIIPAPIAQYLRPYQVDGVKFLHELFVYQKGGILGDDMGLGKTVQVAAFFIAAFGKTGDSRDAKRMRKMRRHPDKPWYPKALIICPGSLIDNWRNELNRWGFWHVDKCHGSEKTAVLEAAASGRLEIVITTYSTYRNMKDQINLIEWDCVVADECHQIKDGSTAVTQAMNEVNAICRIGLTGTAIQNKYEELWTLLNWTNPGHFGPLSVWKKSICEPLRTGQSHDATFHQLKIARNTAKKLVENLLPQFFRRRMKSLIAHQLPKKTDRVIFCPLTETQKEAYERFLESEWVEVVKNHAELCLCRSGKTQGACCVSNVPGTDTKWKAMVFPIINSLQKLSNHLALLLPNSNDLPEKQERQLDFLKETVPGRWKELYEKRDSLFNLANPDFCGKWLVLKKLLKFWHENGDKVLIFSYSVRLLEMLQHLFNHTSYNVSFLSGSTPMEDRQHIVDDFNSDPAQFVFLISTKAGGVGLNITSANKVVIFDPNWNPSFDLQAQDRAYRIGQNRDVEVFRLISAGTVEEIVYARQIYKQQQANIGYTASVERRYFKGVQSKIDQKGEIFGLENLLTFHGDDVVLRDIVNKTNVAEARMGIGMIELNMEDALNDDDNPLKVEDDKGDGAMSQLAALLVNDSSPKSKTRPRPPNTRPSKADPIQAILASAGVEYTHENSEVVGTSRVEAHLSRRAEETGNDAHFGEARLFAGSQEASRGVDVEYEFQPPREVMLRQFCTMARQYGFEPTEFALLVEGWTSLQRTNCLERFYRERKVLLEMGGVGGGDDGGDGEGVVSLSKEPVEEESESPEQTRVKIEKDDDNVIRNTGGLVEISSDDDDEL